MSRSDETQPLNPSDTPSANEAATVSLPSPERPARTSTFAMDEILAGRFRIVRFLGRGGMGEVYEAEGLELREHVALKTVRPEIATDTHAIARFRQEIQLARRVTHQNVCRIFDLFHLFQHGNVTFLTMELLQGETLAQRLRRGGRMDSAGALPIVRQMVAALAAAHAAGLVGYQLEARLAMGQMEKSASRLAAIENEAISERLPPDRPTSRGSQEVSRHGGPAALAGATTDGRPQPALKRPPPQPG